jgi:hypothetical protein
MALMERFQHWLKVDKASPGVLARPVKPTAEQAAEQDAGLTTPVREALVVVEYVDAELGFGRARELATNVSIGLNDKTSGVALRDLQLGMRLMARITRFEHAVSVQPA